MVKPILEDVNSRIGDKATVIKIDVDKNPLLPGVYQIHVVPTLAVFKNGQLLWRKSGVMMTDKLDVVINQFSN